MGWKGRKEEEYERVIVPHVANSVNKRSTSDLWGSSGGVVDVVSNKGDEISGSSEVDGPVVTVVASGRPRCVSIKLGVGDCDAT